jgi:hypothetical protein
VSSFYSVDSAFNLEKEKEADGYILTAPASLAQCCRLMDGNIPLIRHHLLLIKVLFKYKEISTSNYVYFYSKRQNWFLLIHDIKTNKIHSIVP